MALGEQHLLCASDTGRHQQLTGTPLGSPNHRTPQGLVCPFRANTGNKGNEVTGGIISKIDIHKVFLFIKSFFMPKHASLSMARVCSHSFSNILLLKAHEALLIDSPHIPKSQVLLLEVQQSLLSPLHKELPKPPHAFSFAKIHWGKVMWMLPKAPRRGEGSSSSSLTGCTMSWNKKTPREGGQLLPV